MNTKTNLACETGGLVIEVLNKIYDDVIMKTCLLMVCLMKKIWKSWIEFVLTNS